MLRHDAIFKMKLTPTSDFNVTELDLKEAQEVAGRMSLEEVRALMGNVLKIHEDDPNFPFAIILRIKAFLGEYL